MPPIPGYSWCDTLVNKQHSQGLRQGQPHVPLYIHSLCPNIDLYQGSRHYRVLFLFGCKVYFLKFSSNSVCYVRKNLFEQLCAVFLWLVSNLQYLVMNIV